MSILSDAEKARSVADVQAIILASGEEASVWRAQPAEGLFGQEDEVFSEIGMIAVELNRTPPVDLPGEIDAIACVLPGADVRERDRLQCGNETYRVQTVVQERLFGIVTHCVLRLVKIHGG